MKNLRALILLMVAAFGVPSAPALAQSFSAGVGTEFPMGWAVTGTFHATPIPIYAYASYGQFVSFYVDTMNSISEGFNFYNAATGDIVSETLHSADHLDVGFGWEQSPNAGWFVDAAYNHVKGKGRVPGSTILAAIGTTLPAGGNVYDLNGEIHSAALRGGYRWLMKENMTLAVSFGVIKPLDSTTSINRDVTGPIQSALLQAANRQIDQYMDGVYKDDVWIPVLGANLFYNF